MRTSGIIVAAALTVLASATVAAQPGDKSNAEVFAKRLFATDTFAQKTYACFVRSYDAPHLAQHPRQKISAMKLLIAAEILPDDTSLNYAFRLGVTLRRKGDFISYGDCGHAEVSEVKREGVRVGCGGDCGSGGIRIGAGATTASVIVRLDEIALWAADKPDTDSVMELNGGADDRVLRLERVANEMCAPLARGDGELAALRPK